MSGRRWGAGQAGPGGLMGLIPTERCAPQREPPAEERAAQRGLSADSAWSVADILTEEDEQDRVPLQKLRLLGEPGPGGSGGHRGAPQILGPRRELRTGDKREVTALTVPPPPWERAGKVGMVTASFVRARSEQCGITE